MHPIEFRATIEQKNEDLPPFFVVPDKTLRPWGLTATVTVEATIDGYAAGRRSLKPWGRARWFVNLTKAFCRTSGLSPGSRVSVVLVRASPSLPVELKAVIAEHSGAQACWDRLSEARRRAIREHVLSAKRPETRLRRAKQMLAGKV